MNKKDKRKALAGLRRARKLLPGHWTQGRLQARWAKDGTLIPEDEAPVCAIGALNKAFTGKATVGPKGKDQPYDIALLVLDGCLPRGYKKAPTPAYAMSQIVGYNDRGTRKEKQVLGLFDCAIETLEKELA